MRPREDIFFYQVQINPTHSDIFDIAADLQLVLTAVEGKRLENISSSPQKLPVQLPHWWRDTQYVLLLWETYNLWADLSCTTSNLIINKRQACTCFRMFNSSLGGPVPCLHVATPLQLQHITSVAYDHLASIQALQNSLRRGCNTEWSFDDGDKPETQATGGSRRMPGSHCSLVQLDVEQKTYNYAESCSILRILWRAQLNHLLRNTDKHSIHREERHV